MDEPLVLPVSPLSVTMKQVISGGLSVSPFTYQSQAQINQGERWDASLTFPPANRARAAALQGFLIKLRGVKNPFLMGDPAAKLPQRNNSDVTVQLAGAHAVRSRVLQTLGWETTDPAGYALRVGDYIQLGSGITSRLHFVTDNVAIDDAETGEAEINIWPSLRNDYVSGSIVIYRGAVGVWRMKPGNVGSWSESPGVWDDMQFEAMEYLS